MANCTSISISWPCACKIRRRTPGSASSHSPISAIVNSPVCSVPDVRMHDKIVSMPCCILTLMDAPADKDLPLKEDTRLLGRILGDVLRAQTGEEGFARIEAIRQTAIRLRRAAPGD